ncbi:hypothetical protein D3C74_358530 [compost metagenome]
MLAISNDGCLIAVGAIPECEVRLTIIDVKCREIIQVVIKNVIPEASPVASFCILHDGSPITIVVILVGQIEDTVIHLELYI